MERAFNGKAETLYAQGAQLTAGLPIAVEYTTLHPHIGATSFGLSGEYFNNPDLAGKPVFMRMDRTVNLDWTGASPVPGLSTDNYSVRWTVIFTPIAPSKYNIGAQVRGCATCGREFFKLYLDGKFIVQQGRGHMKTIYFADRRPHRLRMEYVHRIVPTHHLVTVGVDLLWELPAAALQAEAVAAVNKADVTVAFVGLPPELEGEELSIKLNGFLSGDRTRLVLPASQVELLKDALRTGKPLVVVLMSGNAVAMPFARRHAKAILEAWYPGQAGGTAIAETLAGDNNPAGRLPVTFYSGVDQLPPFGGYSMKDRTYRYFRG